MNKELIKEEIGNLMEVINEQQALVLSHKGKIPQIEIDILMGNLRKVYDRLMELNKAEQFRHPVAHPGESFQPEELIAVIPEMVPEEKMIVPDVVSKPFEQKEITGTVPTNGANVTAHVQPEVIIAQVETTVAASRDEIADEAVLPQAGLAKERVKEFSKPMNKVSATASLFDETPTVADKFQSTQTLYDKIATAREDQSLAGRLQKNPVSDLKKSIGINEKFAFINELFDGDLNNYNTAIEQLNNCGNFNEANDVLSNKLASQYNWTDEGSSFLQLKNLVERRFSA